MTGMLDGSTDNRVLAEEARSGRQRPLCVMDPRTNNISYNYQDVMPLWPVGLQPIADDEEQRCWEARPGIHAALTIVGNIIICLEPTMMMNMTVVVVYGPHRRSCLR